MLRVSLTKAKNMSLAETLTAKEASRDRKDLRHLLFNLCMDRVDAGELTLDDVPTEMRHTESYYSDEGAHQLGHTAMPGVEDDIAPTAPTVTTGVIDRQAS